MRALALVLALGALSLGGLTAPAAAQPDPIEAARAQMERGLAAAREEDWETAREAFVRAHRLAPRPLILLNLAGAEARTGRLVAARRSYRRFLDEADDTVTTAHVESARRSLSELERRVPRLGITVLGSRDGDVVTLDGEPIEPGPAVSIDPGARVAVLMRAGETLDREEALLAEGEERRLVLDGRVRAHATTDPDLSPATVARESASGDGGSPPLGMRIVRSPWTWVAVGLVVLTVVLGVVFTQPGGRAQPYAGSLDPPVLEVP